MYILNSIFKTQSHRLSGKKLKAFDFPLISAWDFRKFTSFTGAET